MRRKRRACHGRIVCRLEVGEGFAGQEPIDLGEDRGDVRRAACDRLQDHAMADPAHPHLLSRQSELLGKPHRLAAAVGEQLGGLGVRHARDAA
jgi:hypothetical protein